MIRTLLIGLALTFTAPAAFAATLFDGKVDARSAVYGEGILPRAPGSLAPISVDVTGATSLTISASGLTNCCNSTPGTDADGNASGGTNVSGLNGVSGIVVAGRQMFLAGVFVDSANLPTSGLGPAALNYGAGDLDFLVSSTLLNQTFFIGDGLTSGGIAQSFNVTAGADTLLLGFVDAFAFFGVPGYYEDNTGSLDVTVSSSAAAVPLPAGLPLLLAGLGGLAIARRRR